MSRQLAISSAFSILAMAAYVLFSGNAVRTPVDDGSPSAGAQVEISTSDVLSIDRMLPLLTR